MKDTNKSVPLVCMYLIQSDMYFNFLLELVHKVLVLVGKSLKLPKITKLMESNLNYILVCWMQQRYKLGVL